MCTPSILNCGCENKCNNTTGSDELSYSGPNLPGTGINTCDSITVAIQKIDQAILELRQALFITTTTTTTII
jgi:hypothetical protein